MLEIPGAVYRKASLSELLANPKNCRKHDEGDLLVVSASLEKYGQVEPLVVQAGTNMVIGGNGRLLSMQALGWIECDVAVVQCNDQEAQALGIVLNRSAELSRWDTEAVEAALRDIQEDDEVLASMFDHLATVLKIVPGVEPEPVPPAVLVCPECGHRWEKKQEDSEG